MKQLILNIDHEPCLNDLAIAMANDRSIDKPYRWDHEYELAWEELEQEDIK